MVYPQRSGIIPSRRARERRHSGAARCDRLGIESRVGVSELRGPLAPLDVSDTAGTPALPNVVGDPSVLRTVRQAAEHAGDLHAAAPARPAPYGHGREIRHGLVETRRTKWTSPSCRSGWCPSPAPST